MRVTRVQQVCRCDRDLETMREKAAGICVACATVLLMRIVDTPTPQGLRTLLEAAAQRRGNQLPPPGPTYETEHYERWKPYICLNPKCEKHFESPWPRKFCKDCAPIMYRREVQPLGKFICDQCGEPGFQRNIRQVRHTGKCQKLYRQKLEAKRYRKGKNGRVAA